MKLRASGSGAIVNGDVVTAAFSVCTEKGDGDRTVVGGGESVNVVFGSSVIAVRTTRIIETDGTAALDGGGSIGNVHTLGTSSRCGPANAGCQSDHVARTDGTCRPGNRSRALSKNMADGNHT